MTEHQQYCVVRNERGQKMLNLLQDKLELGEAPTTGICDQQTLVVLFSNNTTSIFVQSGFLLVFG